MYTVSGTFEERASLGGIVSHLGGERVTSETDLQPMRVPWGYEAKGAIQQVNQEELEENVHPLQHDRIVKGSRHKKYVEMQ